MTSRVVKICFVHSRIFLFTLIDAVVKINVDELRIKVFQQFLFAYCAYEFVDEDGGNFNAIDKNFTVTRLKRTFSFKYTSSTYFRRGSNAEPFDQAQLLAFSFEQFAHRRRPLCAHLSVSTDSFVGVRACIDFSKRATVSPPLPFFSSHPLSISDAVSTKDTVFSSLVYFLEEEVVVLEF